MRGDLSETSVADLCRGLSAAGATGAVEVGGGGGSARIFFRAGNVYWASSPIPRARLGDRLVSAGLLTQEQLDLALEEQRTSSERSKLGALLVERGLVSRDAIRVFVLEQILDALFEMMQWREGTYVFNPGEVVDEKLPIDIPVDHLLVEVARRQSEWDQIQAVIPDLELVPDFVRGGSSANAALEPDEFTVLANVDGARSVRDLADDLGYSEFEAARIVYGLILLGIIDIASDGDDDAADQARRAARAEQAAAAAPPDVVDDDGIDVARALEEALASADRSPAPPASPADRPRVKLHVDDDVSDYVATRAAGPEEGADEPVPAPPPAAEPPASGDDDTATGGGPPAADEPEPWVAVDDVEPPTPSEDLGFFAGATAPQEARGEELGDDEFESLLSELAVPPEEAAAREGSEPREEAPASHDDARDEQAAEAPASHDDARDEQAEGGGSDVSEFLRELSQLAVDEPPANANPGPTRQRPAAADDEGARPDAATGPPTREEDRRLAAEKRDERNKKKGLFGWGR